MLRGDMRTKIDETYSNVAEAQSVSIYRIDRAAEK